MNHSLINGCRNTFLKVRFLTINIAKINKNNIPLFIFIISPHFSMFIYITIILFNNCYIYKKYKIIFQKVLEITK